MTCIVGLVDQDRVIIGGDSAATAGNAISIWSDPKVFKVGDFIFGCEGSFRMIQLMKYKFIPPKIKPKDVFKYLCTDFPDEIMRLMKEGFFSDPGKFGSFLVGYKNRLFEFDYDLQVGENINGMASICAGADIALGSLYTSRGSVLTSDQRVLKALEASAFYCTSVEKPFRLVNT